jgi:hypothetical protein
MPQAIISIDDFYRLFGESNIIEKREACNLIKQYTQLDQEYRASNKVNYIYLNKYDELRGSIKLIRCSNTNHLIKGLEEMKQTDLVQFGDFDPVSYE